MAAVLAVFVLTWLPRGLALDRFVTPDEPLWLGRSANFYQALAHGNLRDTYQYLHPGVTAMWIGTIGYLWGDPGYGFAADQQIGGQQDRGTKPGAVIAEVLAARGVDALGLLATLRAAMVIANTLVLSAVFLAARRLFGDWTALLGSLLIAFDPFNIALSRIMHLDGLASNLMLLSLLLFLTFREVGRQRRDLVLSGIVAGLAWLTRTATGILVPFIGLLTAIDLYLRWRVHRALDRRELAAAGRSLLVWGLTGLVTFIALWPAMWVEPMQTLRLATEGALGLASDDQAVNVTFFRGAIHPGDPGWLFYPLTFLWRTTPAVLIGLVLAAVCLAAPSVRSRIRASDQRALLALLLFALLYGLLLTVATKKYDRYLLPVYGPLDLVAAWGWVRGGLLLGSAAHGIRRHCRLVTLSIVGAVTLAQIITAAPAFPYYFGYYNPLLGGTARAIHVAPVGWGEGLDQVADYLEALPHAEALTVAVAAPHRTLDYLFDGTALQAAFPEMPGEVASEKDDPLLTWAKSDFYVLYVTNLQEGQIPQPFLDYFAAQTPVMTARIQGLDYAYLYDVRTAPLPDPFLGPDSPVSEWDGVVRIVTQELPTARLLGGDAVAARFYLQSLDADTVGKGDLQLAVRLVGEDGRDLVTAEIPVVPPEEARTIWPVDVPIRIPENAKAGTYQVDVEVRRPENDQALAWSRQGIAEQAGTPLTAGAIRVMRAPRQEASPADEDDDSADSPTRTGPSPTGASRAT